MYEMIKDYKQLGSQHETKNNDPKTKNRTQQNKNNSDKLKTGLNKMENDSDDDHNQDKECSELNYYQAMYPCRLT